MGRRKKESITTDKDDMGRHKIEIILEERPYSGPIITKQRTEIAKMLSTKCCEIDGERCQRYDCKCFMLCDLFSCPYWKMREEIKPVTPGGEKHKTFNPNMTMQEEVNSQWAELWEECKELTKDWLKVEHYTRPMTKEEEIAALQEAEQWAKAKIKPLLRKEPLSRYALFTYENIQPGDTKYFEDMSLMTITEIKDKAASMGFKMREIREWLKQYEQN